VGAFARSPSLVVVATRLPVRLADAGGWRDTLLPLPDGATGWTDVLRGAAVSGSAPQLAQVLSRYPVALLVRSD
jgi:(1->4)-alpha-D-glucan 1-alpha-D-glucosylmutase